ncbi:MAG: hypothetical protein M1508_02895 [Nitrospirae bacterium]|nr:hypothetical protein [Nitrospirota bacterium]MCL5422116.1 hypothetical protein [Nitrospirota bacterium]
MKKGFFIGAICGGALGIIISLSMDLILGGALGSGWREAVAHDLGALFGRTFDNNSFIVVLGVIVVIGFVAAFGALVGGMFGVMITRLFSFLIKEQQ